MLWESANGEAAAELGIGTAIGEQIPILVN